MIKLSAKMDTSGFQKSLVELAGLKKDVPKVLRRVAGNVVKDCVKLTPPFGGAPSSESFNTQRKSGLDAVSRDLNQLFKDVDDLEMVKNAEPKSVGSRLANYARQGNKQAVVKILNSKKIKAEDFVKIPSREIHLAYRTNYGKVRRLYGAAIYIQTGLNAYIKSVQKRVGGAKHGWMMAISKLGVKAIPAWIRNQNTTSGFCEIKGEGTNRMEITFENNVSYIQRKGRNLKIIQEAFRSTGVRLVKEVEKLLEARMKRATRA